MLLLAATMTVARQCFNSGGDYVSEFAVCNPADVAGPCCSGGDVCLSNGLCQNTAGDTYQGGCTDKSYKSASCPNFCTGNKVPNQSIFLASP